MIRIIVFTSACILCFCVPVFSQQPYSLKGTISKDFEGKQLILLKYNSPFSQEFVANIDIVNNEFFFRTQLIEPDAYMIRNTVNNIFFTFIWDGDVTLEINALQFYKPIVKGSPLTDELSQYSRTLQERYFVKLRKVDSLITNTKDKNILDSLRSVRNNLYDFAKVGSIAYDLEYFKQHPNSFVSLFRLTYTGDQFLYSKEQRAAFEGLSDQLKKHSRARYYLER